jgi:hypothetical protein
MSDRAAWPLLLPASELSWPRRLGVALAVGLLLYSWAPELLAPHRVDSSVLIVAGTLALSLALANLNHAGAQIAARGFWWAQLAFGAAMSWTVLGHNSQSQTLLIILGGGGALLLAGSAGLRADTPTRGAFAPVAFRRTLLVSIGLSVAEVQALSVATSGLLDADDPLAYQLGGCALLLAGGLVGLYRLRFWGVLLHWLGTALLASFAVKAASAADLMVVYAWGVGVFVQLLLPMPMLLAIVRRTPVAPPAHPTLVPRLFFGAVAALMLLSIGCLTVFRF